MQLEDYRIVLASQSPRRKELLGRLTENFEVRPGSGEEHPVHTTPREMVEELSEGKAWEVYGRVKEEKSGDGRPLLVIGADTVVAFSGAVLGKPKDREDAFRMLRMLSGTKHEVFTGVTLIFDGEALTAKTFSERTEVTFSEMTDEEIRTYIETGDPMDKAGAYGIQSGACKFVAGISGDYFNVMGFPVSRIYRELARGCKSC